MTALEKAKPTNKVPHCLCTMVETMEDWWWEDIMRPRRRMMRAGKGLVENE